MLLVFCYLIVPSVAAMLYAETIGQRLAIGWTMGTIVSALGVYLSLVLDLPTGATIVCTFGLVLILMAVVRPLVVTRAAVTNAARSREAADGTRWTAPWQRRLPDERSANVQSFGCSAGTAGPRSPTKRSSAFDVGRDDRSGAQAGAGQGRGGLRCSSSVVLAVLVLVASYLGQASRTAANPDWLQLAAGLCARRGAGGAVARHFATSLMPVFVDPLKRR